MAWNDSFDDMVQADLDSSFFGTSEFAESLVVYQGDQAPRTITCRVFKTGSVIEEGVKHQDTATAIEVMARDNETTGITNPQPGDYVIYDDEEYDYSLSKNADSGAAIYVFRRKVVSEYGRNKPPSI